MIKPFEVIKFLVSSVCTVPNTRNTRRSTALGETPLIWYCARYQNHPIPPALDGRGCRVQRGSVHVCVLGVTRQYLHAQHGCCFLLSFFCPHPTVSGGGTGGLVRNQVFQKGLRFKKFQSLMMQPVKIPFAQKKESKKILPKKQKRNQLVWTSSEDGRKVLVYIAQCTCHVKAESSSCLLYT